MPSTAQALSEITDEGLFERVAAAVLWVGEPMCATMLHLGVNASGQTRKAPLDGIANVTGAQPPHLVAVHHTITSAERLRGKWLHDPATVKPRKAGRKPTAPPGDLVKTAEIVAKERERTPDLAATLVLTTNIEPDEELVRDVAAAGRAQNIDVIVWSRSRLAHVLDHTPEGQSIRRQLLGLDQSLLSADLLAILSTESLRAAAPLDDPAAWVPRALDDALGSAPVPVSFLSAGSGLGKTVACQRWLQKHLDAGGFGLVLPHEVIAEATSLEQAVALALQRLRPGLDPAQSAMAFCSPERPLMLTVEDINRSGQASRLVEKLLGWGGADAEFGKASARSWRLICPVWPQVIGAVGVQARKRLEPLVVLPPPLSVEEGAAAVLRRAQLSGRTASVAQARTISTALGHDPSFDRPA